MKDRSIRISNTGRIIKLHNTNQLLSTMKECDGIKTGTTRAAGQCLVASATKDDTSLIAIVMKVANGKRWQEAKQLLEYGFEKKVKKTGKKTGKKTNNKAVKKKAA